MNQLVVAPLQEGGIDCNDRLQAFGRHAGGKGDGVLLRDADIEIAVGKALLEFDQARAFAHRRGDPDQPRILLRHVAEPLSEHLRECRLGHRARLDQSHRRIELARPVVGDRIGLGQLVALALARHDVQELRALEMLDVLQRRDQRIEVVAVDRSDVVEAEFLEQRGRHHQALGALLEALGQFEQRRRDLQHVLAHVLGGGVELAAHQPGQVAVQGADRRADRHVVVVQDHQQVAIGHAGVVQRLEGHARAHRAVADHCDRMAVLALQAGGHGHAERGGDAGGRMRGAEGVVIALGTSRKAGQAPELAQARHAIAAAGEDLVRIGLMAHVPHQPVVRGIEDVMQGDRQFHRAQVGAEVAPGARNAVQDKGAQLLGQRRQLGACQLAQVGRVVDVF